MKADTWIGIGVLAVVITAIILIGAGGPSRSFAQQPTASQEGQAPAYRLGETDFSALTNEDWRAVLTEMQFYVTRKDGTERAFANAYWDQKQPGIYYAAGTDIPLFSSLDKYRSGTGWPSFTRPITPDAVAEHEDRRFGMVRTEIVCAVTGHHLGHVFRDGPRPTGLRYCMNSAALRFVPMSEEQVRAETERLRKAAQTAGS